MRKIIMASFLSAALAIPSAALAQETKSVDDYLCTFGGKCGDEPEAVVTKEAPETKGFSLTRPETEAANARPSRTSTGSRGFSLGKAPETKAAPVKSGKPAQVASKSTAKKPASVAKASKGSVKRGDLSLAFELGSDVLTPKARDNAKAFAEALQRPELASKRVKIEGHTDAQGGREFNMDLSRRRAQAVAGYLTELGVSADRLEVEGYGFDRPIPGLSASAGQNRRVEAEVIS